MISWFLFEISVYRYYYISIPNTLTNKCIYALFVRVIQQSSSQERASKLITLNALLAYY